METLGTTADRGAASYLANEAAQQALVRELRERLRVAALGGPESSRARHLARGKLLPRDRIDVQSFIWVVGKYGAGDEQE